MKRSKAIALVMMGAGIVVLAACEEPKVEARVYDSVSQCLNDPDADPAACEANFKHAAEQHAAVAPKYADQAACEADFGAEQCEPAPGQTESGGSVFMPLMMGYMMGSLLSGGRSGVAAQPLYRSADDSKTYRTANNQSVGSTTGKTTVARSAAAAPAAKPYTVSRGGFGARARTLGSAST